MLFRDSVYFYLHNLCVINKRISFLFFWNKILFILCFIKFYFSLFFQYLETMDQFTFDKNVFAYFLRSRPNSAIYACSHISITNNISTLLFSILFRRLSLAKSPRMYLIFWLESRQCSWKYLLSSTSFESYIFQ